MPNVHKLPVNRQPTPGDDRVVEDFDYSDFCTLLEAGSALNVTHLNGMTLLQYPRAVLIDNGGRCTCVTVRGTSMDGYIRAALAELDRDTIAA